MACFCEFGKIPCENDKFTMAAMVGARVSCSFLSSHVGTVDQDHIGCYRHGIEGVYYVVRSNMTKRRQ